MLKYTDFTFLSNPLTWLLEVMGDNRADKFITNLRWLVLVWFVRFNGTRARELAKKYQVQDKKESKNKVNKSDLYE